MEAYCKPQAHLRDVAVVPQQTAVLYIDTQNFNCHLNGAGFQDCSPEELEVLFTRAATATTAAFIVIPAIL